MNRSDRTRQRESTEATAPQHGVRLADMRAANRACVIAALEREGPLSRIALARLIGLSRTTVGSIVAELLREGSVSEVGRSPATHTGGRRAVVLAPSSSHDQRGRP